MLTGFFFPPCDPALLPDRVTNAPASADRFQSEFCVFYWNVPAGKGAGSLPATSAVIRLYSSGFGKQQHVYYQATNQTDINLVKAKLKQSFRIIF